MLTNFPHEILLIITGHLDRTDIINLAKCNRQLDLNIRPAIFREIEIKDKCFWTLSHLVHLMLCKPAYAQAVCDLRITPTRAPCRCGKCNDIVLDRELIEPILKASVDETEKETVWYEDLTKGTNADAWVALLLPHLTNLQAFHLPLEYSPWIDQVLLHAENCKELFPEEPPLLPRLTKIYAICSEPTRRRGGGAVPFLRLPSLRSFRAICSVLETRKTRDLEKMPQGFSNVTDIFIIAMASERSLHWLINSCKRLEYFLYIQTTGRVAAANSPSRVCKSLYRHRETLQLLAYRGYDVDIPRVGQKEASKSDVEDSSDDENSDTELRDEFLGSLADFSSLRGIHVRASNIVDPIADPDPTHDMRRLSEYLPSSLDIINLYDFTSCDTFRLTTQLEYLVSIARQHFPCLVKIVLGVDFPAFSCNSHESKPPSNGLSPAEQQLSSLAGHELYTSLKKLCTLCNEAGVKFRISHRKGNRQTLTDIICG
ncbi:hypothetical protein MW887_004544 [Aspergillus wentii]|nr:hypothetical protein MW887_004544 [Aspergillus wentii]